MRKYGFLQDRQCYESLHNLLESAKTNDKDWQGIWEGKREAGKGGGGSFLGNWSKIFMRCYMLLLFNTLLAITFMTAG